MILASKFAKMDIPNASFDSSKIYGCQFIQCSLLAANFTAAALTEVNVVDCNLALVDLNVCSSLNVTLKHPIYQVAKGAEFALNNIDTRLPIMLNSVKNSTFSLKIIQNIAALATVITFLEQNPNLCCSDIEITNCSLSDGDFDNIIKLLKIVTKPLRVFNFARNYYSTPCFNRLCSAINSNDLEIKTLILSQNRLNNDNLDTLFSSVLQHRCLTDFLDVSNNNFDYNNSLIRNPNSIVSAPKKHLVIDVSKNKIGDQGIKFLAEGNFAQFLSTRINLQQTGITLKSIPAILQLLASYKSSQTSSAQVLFELNFADNQLNDDFITELMNKLILNGIKLNSLDLSNNHLTHASLSISALIKKCGLQKLYLAKNTKICVTSALKKFSTELEGLKVLDLSGNNIHHNEILAMCPGLKAVRSLSELELNDNCLGDEGAFIVKEILLEHPAIVAVGLAGNQISDAGAKAISSVFEELTHVDIGNNEISDHGIISVAIALPSNRTLRCLNLSRNKLSNAGIEKLMESLGDNQGIEAIALAGNSFDTKILPVIEELTERNHHIQLVELAQPITGHNLEGYYRRDYQNSTEYRYNHDLWWNCISLYSWCFNKNPVFTVGASILTFPLLGLIALGVLVADLILDDHYNEIQRNLLSNRELYQTRLEHAEERSIEVNTTERLPIGSFAESAAATVSNVTYRPKTLFDEHSRVTKPSISSSSSSSFSSSSISDRLPVRRIDDKQIVEIDNYRKQYPLHFAIRYKKDLIEISHIFNEQYCKISDGNGDNPLHLMASFKVQANDVKTYRTGLKRFLPNCNLNERNRQSFTPLHIALKEGNVPFINQVINLPELDYSINDLNFPIYLHLAAKYCAAKTFATIFELTFAFNPEYNVDTLRFMGARTILHSACENIDESVLILLLSKYKPNTNLVNDNSKRPLTLYCEKEIITLEAIQLFINNQAKIHAVDLYAVIKKSKVIFEYMLQHTDDVGEIIKIVTLIKSRVDNLLPNHSNQALVHDCYQWLLIGRIKKKLNIKPGSTQDQEADRKLSAILLGKMEIIAIYLELGESEINKFTQAIYAQFDRAHAKNTAEKLDVLGRCLNQMDPVGSVINSASGQVIKGNAGVQGAVNSTSKMYIGAEAQIQEMLLFLNEIKNNPSSNRHFLLLSGPSGTGKTQLTTELTKKAGFTLVPFQRANQEDKYINQLENRILEVFKGAKLNQGYSCIFMDEIDAICPELEGVPSPNFHNPDGVTTLIQIEIDKLKGTRVVLIGATNYIERLKPAIKRRAGVPVVFTLPNKENRLKIVQSNWPRHIRLEDQAILHKLSEASSGWSPSLLCLLLTTVESRAKLSSNGSSVTKNDFLEVFEAMRNSYKREYKDIEIELPRLEALSTNPVNGLIGLDAEIKEQLCGVCTFLDNPEKYRKNGIKMKRNILLYGPPGTGKTSFARAVAQNSNAVFIVIDGGKNKIPTGTNLVLKSFELAKNFEKAVIFIDEIDALAWARETIQTQMDGLNTSSNVLCVIAATNFPDSIPRSILNRFQIQLEVPLPNISQREELFLFAISSKAEVQFTGLVKEDITAACKIFASRSDGLSARQIIDLMNNVVERNTDIEIISKKATPISESDIIKIIERTRTNCAAREIGVFGNRGHHVTTDSSLAQILTDNRERRGIENS